MWLSFMLVAGLMSGLQAPTDDGTPIRPERVRGMDAAAQAIIDEGCRRSPVFAALVQDVERSKFIVYVDSVPAMNNGMRGALLHQTSDAPYLRINVKRLPRMPDQVKVLAHELQHVREVIQAGISADAAEMDMLFRRIADKRLAGDRRQQFETVAALRVSDLVAADLRKNPDTVTIVGSCRAAIQ